MNHSAPPLRLLFLETEDWAFCQHRLPLARAARDAGYRVGLVAPESDRAAEIRGEGFDFIPLEMKRAGVNPLEESRVVARIAAVYRRERPDIVHHVALKSVLHGTIAARACGVPAIVNSITGLGYAFTGEGPRRAALRLVLSKMLQVALDGPEVRVVFQNPDDRALFVDGGIVVPSRCAVVRGSGVDTSRFAPSPEPEGTPVILLASRLLWDKGIGELVEAGRILRREGLALRIVLAGDRDPANPACIPSATLEGWRTEGLVELPGHVKDMAALLRAAHIACLPSYREGLPLFLLEAAAAGRPGVTVDVPGCREAVRHGENGLVVPVRDGAALAGALRQLLGDPALRRRMGARGREIAVAEFAKEKITAGFLALYGEALREAGARPGGGSTGHRAAKRAMDVSLSALGLCAASPVLAAAAVAVKLDSPGPIFFESPRVGKGGRPFRLYKLRTMRVHEPGSGPDVTAGTDERITRVGRFLRKTKLDELPQLLNVLRGEVSLVGPRPEAPRYVEKYPGQYETILSVKPGLTDRATLEYVGEEEILAGSDDPERTYVEEILPKKMELYLRYIENQSLGEDFAIVAKTIARVAGRAWRSLRGKL